MAVVFCLDTSALVKRYNQETGSDVLDQLLNIPFPEELFYISSLVIVEFYSVITRLVGGRLSQEAADAAVGTFRTDINRSKYRVLPLSNLLVEIAVERVSKYRLRTLDAIHLAAAWVIFTLAGPEPQKVVVSADRRLLEVTESSGFKILNPDAPKALEILASIRT